jgi:hypothetical protein
MELYLGAIKEETGQSEIKAGVEIDLNSNVKAH